ncbi:MAG: 5-formyltetrahydrofolate cyclo-ligase [Gammaproteobacteria bacterium]
MYEEKAVFRRLAYDARNAQADKDSLSKTICARFVGQSAYFHAETVMWYCHCRSEVRTLSALAEILLSKKRIVIPYCTKDAQGIKQLGLWHLQDRSELVPGLWGILEPPRHRWAEAGKEVDPRELDLIMVPGVAFDPQGGRLGNGQGYYDRLLQRVRTDTVLTAVCYEAQLFNRIPMDTQDIYMDYVITENAIYRGKGRYTSIASKFK